MNRDQGERLRWLVSLGIALGAHAAAIAVTLWLHSPSVAPDPGAPMSAVMVELAPAPEAPPTPPSALPDGPSQQQQRRAEPDPSAEPEVDDAPEDDLPEPAPDPPKPAPSSQPQPVPSQDAPPVPQPEAALAAASPPPSAAATKPPQDTGDAAEDVGQSSAPASAQAASSGARLAGPQTVSGTDGAQTATWRGILLGHLERYRRYPRQAERRRQQGVAHVRFLVDRQGHVSAPEISRSSGHRLLDEETLATVRRASPVPPPPAGVAGDPVSVTVPVNFHLRRR